MNLLYVDDDDVSSRVVHIPKFSFYSYSSFKPKSSLVAGYDGSLVYKYKLHVLYMLCMS